MIIGSNNQKNDIDPTLKKCEKFFNKKEDIIKKQIIALQKITDHLDHLLINTEPSNINKTNNIRSNIARISKNINILKALK